MLENGENKEYLPIEGLADFNKATVALLLGSDNKAVKDGRVSRSIGFPAFYIFALDLERRRKSV